MSEREKIIRKIQMLRRQAVSETSIGNEGAGELFEEKVQELLLKHSLTEEDIKEKEEKVSAFINELGKTTILYPFGRSNAKTINRVRWFEEFAKVVAKGYACEVEILPTMGGLNIIGYDLDREICSFVFLKLAEIANDRCKLEMSEQKKNVGRPKAFNPKERKVIEFPSVWMGDDIFIDNYHSGFRDAIQKSYEKHELDEQKRNEVREYAENNKDSDFRYNYYILHPESYNDLAFELGKSRGDLIAKKATKNISALEVKRPAKNLINEDLVFVLMDRSGSMWGQNMTQAVEGTISFAKTVVQKGFSVGVIAFDDRIDIVVPPTKEITEGVEGKIREIYSRGSTDMAAALRTAVSKFLQVPRDKKREICIITDGMPDDRNATLKVATDAKRMGIKIRAIGTDNAQQEFLDELCSEKGMGLLVDRTQLQLTIGSMANSL